MSTPPFWPRTSPHFLRVRVAVRRALATLEYPPTVFVGLSGGADSLALIAAVCAETRGTKTAVTALCVDHQLQPGSREVAQRAAAQAEAWGANTDIITVDVDTSHPDGMEAAARRARYQGFAQRAGAAPVMVAHTANDQAENLLLSSLRGHVTGMSFETFIEGARIIRPLLSVRRADTLGACEEVGADIWHDPHNEREDFRRVAIRKRVLPLLEEIHGGDVVAVLGASASDIAHDDAFLHSLVPDVAAAEELVCADLAGMAQPVRKRVIARWLTANDASPTRAALAAIDALISDWSGQGNVAVADMTAKNRGARLEVQRDGGKLRLLRFHAP